MQKLIQLRVGLGVTTLKVLRVVGVGCAINHHLPTDRLKSRKRNSLASQQCVFPQF